MDHPFYFSATDAAGGEREAMVMASPSTNDSTVSPCFLSCLAYLHRNFPSQYPTSCHLSPSLCSQEQLLPWDRYTIPMLQVSGALPPRGRDLPLSGDSMAAARIVWFLFHIGCHRSAVSLSVLNISLLIQTVAPMWRLDTYFSYPTTKGMSSPNNSPVFHSSSFILLRFASFCILFSSGQLPLSAFIWCSESTTMSEDVVLMYPWRNIALHIHLHLRHLVHLNFLTIRNKTAMTIHVQFVG